MKKLSIFMIAAGLLLIICGNVFYKHHQNPDDSGGSASITTLNGNWSVKIPAFMGGVVFLFGAIFLYVDADIKRKNKGLLQ
ncbi:hypothetical protein FPZ42_06505 [Mucilaginibacter achroorhodeus]|uniref:Uncharacterized protein n=1 Tax=Mucilaginibacter achroorhodeus TaxID=2599294 RepID=A0A563U5T1_9SPHI|nr:hypothetical protein [Mucilaginibacter achroorhodeus]TWR26685.1 hypothetical protein FPZ42_06505 [Mucilaginibacter achroorhodeus]